MAGLIQRLELSSSYYRVNNIMRNILSRKEILKLSKLELGEITLACISKTVCFSCTFLSFSLFFSLKYIHLDIHLYFILNSERKCN